MYTPILMYVNTCHQEDRRVLKISEILRPTCDKFALSPFRSLLNVTIETTFSINDIIAPTEINITNRIDLAKAKSKIVVFLLKSHAFEL